MADRLWTPEQDLEDCLILGFDAELTRVDGSDVLDWTDHVGGRVANHQGIPPQWTATGPGGKPGVRIADDRSRMLFSPTGMPIGAQASTVLVDATPDKEAAGSYRFYFGWGANGGHQQRAVGQTNDGQGSIQQTLQDDDAVTGYGWPNLSRVVIATNPENSPSVIFNIDGLEDTVKSFNAPPNTGTAEGVIGSFVGYPLVMLGYIQQIRAFNRVLTTDERGKLAGWSSWKTGKNGRNLPSGSPFKTAAPRVSSGGIILPRRRRLIILS